MGGDRGQALKYWDGRDVKIGDRVKLGEDSGGVVVASIDTREYSPVCTEAEWSFLQKGVLVDFPRWGIVHYEEPDEDLEFLARAD